MSRRILSLLLLPGLLLLPLSVFAEASGKGGHSSEQPSQPSRATAKKAPQKGGLKPRSEYTQAQRDQILERAREICRKKFGQPSRVYRIDYSAGKVWCEPPSF